MSAPGWIVDHLVDDAAALHALEPIEPIERQVWICTPTTPALVLGSAQDETEVQRAHLAERGIQLARRRTGGGAVLVDPGACTWIDVVMAREDALVLDDVGRSFDWLGAAWVRSLRGANMDARTHDGAMRRTPLSDRICFAGVGPGEVLVDDRKAVGLAQRRGRHHVRFQCLVHHTWQPEAILDCFDLPLGERSAALRSLAGTVTALHPAGLLERFLAALPR